MPHDVYNITQAAGAYSTVAGLIAGFAFAALVWVVERFNSSQDQPETQNLNLYALVLLGIVFLGNVLVAFLYAQLAGQPDPSTGRVAILSYVAGTNFALFAVLTIESLVFIVATARIPQVVSLFRVLFFFGLLISAAFQTSSGLGLLESNAPYADVVAAKAWRVVAVGLVGLLMLAGGIFLSTRSGERRRGLNSIQSLRLFMTVLLALVTASGILFGVVSVMPPDVTLPAGWGEMVALLAAFLVAWAIVFMPVETQQVPR